MMQPEEKGQSWQGLTHDDLVDKMRGINPSIIPISEYSDLNGSMFFYCARCENTFSRPASFFLSGKHTKCPICGNRKLSYREIVEMTKRSNPNLEIKGKIVKMSDTVDVRCIIHDYNWPAYVQNLLKGHGCPICSKTKKVTEEEFKVRVAKLFPAIQILGSFSAIKSRIQVRCGICENTWAPIAQSLYLGHGCPKCAGKKRKTTEEIKAELAVSRPDVELLGEYHSAHERILYRFLKCGHECAISTAHIKCNRGCPECANALKGVSQRGSKEQLQKALDQRFGDIEVCGEYVNNTTPLPFRCRRCGHEWVLAPKEIKLSQGCPNCHKTGTSFLQEFIFAFMSHALPGRDVLNRDKTAIGKELDIYIPSLKLAIEPGSWYWHKDTQERDREKDRLCRQAGINLITLYDHYDNDKTPFPGSIVTKNDLCAYKNFYELVGFCYGFLERAGISLSFRENEIEAMRLEAQLASRDTTTELLKEEVAAVNPKILVLGEYRGSNSPIRIKCQYCGHEWTPLAHRLRKPINCSGCHHFVETPMLSDPQS